MPTSSYIETIESKGWCLYDASAEFQLETWEEREARRGPVSTPEEGGMYLFVPQPGAGQTLREAYSITMGVGSSFYVFMTSIALNIRHWPLSFLPGSLSLRVL